MISKEKFYEIKGMLRAGKATEVEINDFLETIDAVFEMVYEASADDVFGTEGYEHRLGWD